MPPYEIYLCEKYGMQFVKATEDEEEENVYYLIPDIFSETKAEVQKTLSIYWLYLSCDFMKCLPLEPFLKLRDPVVEEVEKERVYSLEMACLQAISKELHSE